MFETLGRLYIRDLAGGAPRPLTAPGRRLPIWPAWSRDGRTIAFVSWNDQRLGEIRTVAADGSGLRTVTHQPGHYRRPRFSPDGATIVYELSGGGGLTSNQWSGTTGIFRIPSAGGAATRILGEGSNPHFGAASDRVFLEVSQDQKRKLISVDLNGGNRRDHAQGEMVTGYEVSPDGRTIAFRENYNLFVTPFFGGARVMDVGARGPSSRSPASPPTARLMRAGPRAAGGSPGVWGRRSTAPTSPICCATRPAAPTPRRPPAPRCRSPFPPTCRPARSPLSARASSPWPAPTAASSTTASS